MRAQASCMLAACSSRLGGINFFDIFFSFHEEEFAGRSPVSEWYSKTGQASTHRVENYTNLVQFWCRAACGAAEQASRAAMVNQRAVRQASRATMLNLSGSRQAPRASMLNLSGSRQDLRAIMVSPGGSRQAPRASMLNLSGSR
jgi:hypothetical protein